MKLYKYGATYSSCPSVLHEATLDDLRAALAEFGMVAAPVEPTESMETAGLVAHQTDVVCNGKVCHSMRCACREMYKAMIQAAQENTK